MGADRAHRPLGLAGGLPPGLLELEITEGAIVRDHAAAAALLGELRASGVCIAIDDFGVGYSSLSYLQDLPVDRIKIDRVFLRGIQPAPAGDQGRLVAALVAMARSLGLRITAEGVETPAQADFLRRTGCDEVQGYFYGRPCEASRFDLQWLAPAGTD